MSQDNEKQPKTIEELLDKHISNPAVKTRAMELVQTAITAQGKQQDQKGPATPPQDKGKEDPAKVQTKKGSPDRDIS